MKRLSYFIAIFTIFIVNNTFAQDNLAPNTKDEGLKGKVKKVKLKSYEAKEQSGTFVKSNLKVDEQCWEYNIKSKLIVYSIYNADSKLSLIETYTYNSGCMTEHKKIIRNITEEYSTCKCDDKGNVIENTEKVHLPGIATYKYNDKGKTIEEFFNFPSDGSWGKYTYTYNESGNLIKVYQINQYNEESSYTYKYDAKGNKIESNSKYSNNSMKYDVKGNRVEETSYKNGKIDYKLIYKYDQQGNVIESLRYNSEGCSNEKSIYIYVYDNFKNWIKKTSYTENNSFGIKENVYPRIEEREIEYFQ